MTTNPMGIERKVRQLDNDVQSIYEMLAAIQGTQLRHGNRIDEVSEKVDGLEGRFDGLEGRFDGLERRFDGLEGRFDGLERRFDGIEGRFDGIERRFDGIDNKLVTVLATLQRQPPASD